MKKILLTLSAILLLPTLMFAQEQEVSSLFGGKEIIVGGYGAPLLQYSTNTNTPLWVGGKGGVIINHHISIGGAGYGVAPVKDYLDNKNYFLTGGYGGLYFEYINSHHSLIHFSANVMLGVGGMAIVDRSYKNKNIDDLTDNILDNDFIFVIEPQIEAELNITSWMKIAIGVSYKYTSNLDMNFLNTANETIYIDNDVLNGVAVGLSFKFGKF